VQQVEDAQKMQLQPDANEPHKIQSQVAELKAANARLESAGIDTHQVKHEMAELTAANTGLESECQALDARLADLKTAHASEVVELKSEGAKLKAANARLESAGNDTHVVKHKIAELTAANTRLESECQALDARLADLKTAHVSEVAELKAANARLESTGNDTHQVKHEMAELTVANARLESECHALDARLASEVAELKSEVAQLQVANARLESAGNNTHKVKHEMVELKSEVSQLKAANARLESECQALDTNLVQEQMSRQNAGSDRGTPKMQRCAAPLPTRGGPRAQATEEEHYGFVDLARAMELTRLIKQSVHSIQRTATHCHTLQHTATVCNTLQHTATVCNSLQHTATHCNTLQHSATLCHTLQHAATLCNTLQHTDITHCNTLQHTATHTATGGSRAHGRTRGRDQNHWGQRDHGGPEL